MLCSLMFCAPRWMLEPGTTLATSLNAVNGGQTTMSTSFTVASSSFKSRTRSSASATVLFIFQFPAIISFRSFFISNSRKEHDHRARLGPIGIAGNRRRCLPWEDIVRGVKGCVDPAAPWVFACLIHSRQLEIERLPIGVQDHVKEQLFLADFHGEGNAV